MARTIVESVALRLTSGEVPADRASGELLLLIDFERSLAASAIVTAVKSKLTESGYVVSSDVDQIFNDFMESEILDDAPNVLDTIHLSE